MLGIHLILLDPFPERASELQKALICGEGTFGIGPLVDVPCQFVYRKCKSQKPVYKDRVDSCWDGVLPQLAGA